MGKDSTISCLSRAKTLSANLSGAVLLHNAQLISRQAYGTPLSAFTCDPYSKSLNLVTTSLSYILASEQGLFGAAVRAAELWNRRRREAWHETDRKKNKTKKNTKRLQGRNCLPERDVMISETWQVLQLRRKQTLLQKKNLIAWRCHSPARMYQYSVILFQRLGKLCSVSMSGMAGHVCLPAVFNFFCSEPIIIL